MVPSANRSFKHPENGEGLGVKTAPVLRKGDHPSHSPGLLRACNFTKPDKALCVHLHAAHLSNSGLSLLCSSYTPSVHPVQRGMEQI